MAYALTQGDGDYTIRLYKNLSGTKYRSVAKATVAVELEDPLAPYLASTGEITFSQEDQVGQTAQALCQGLEDDGDKALALYRYVAGNFTYDDPLEDLEKEIRQRRAGGSPAGGNVPPSRGGPGRRALPVVGWDPGSDQRGG